MSKDKWGARSSQGAAGSRRLVRAVALSGAGAAVVGLAFGAAVAPASASSAVKAGWYAETGVSAPGAGSQSAGQAFLRSAAAVQPKVIGYETKKVDPGTQSGVAHTVSFGALQYPNGLRVFCIDGLLLAPSSNPSKPISKTDQKKLAYLLSRYSTSNDKTTVAAVSYIARQLLDKGWSFDARAFKTLPASVQSAVTNKVGALQAEAASYVGGYTPVVTNTAGKADDSGAVRSGTATVATKASTGKTAPGVPFTASITGGQFADGKSTVKGVTGTAPVSLGWTTPAAKDGDHVQVKVTYTGVPATSYYEYDAPHQGEQRVIGAAPSGTAAKASPSATVNVPTPAASTVVSTHVWKPGQTITDVLTTKGIEGSPKVDITAAAALTPRPKGVASCEDLSVAQWEKAFTGGKVSTIATAQVKGAAANTDVRIPLHLSADLPTDVTSGDWCGSISETVRVAGTQKQVVVTKFGAVNEWGSLTVAKKPAPPIKPPVIPTGGLTTAPARNDPAAGNGLLAAGVLVGSGTFWLNRRRRRQSTT